MGKRLSDLERKQVLAYYLECNNLRETGRKFNIDMATVRNILKTDTEFHQKSLQKKEENTNSILSMFDERKDKVKNIIDRYLTEALDETKIDKTGLRDLFTAYGIIIDKQFKAEEIKMQREKLKLEKEKFEFEKQKKEETERDGGVTIINDTKQE